MRPSRVIGRYVMYDEIASGGMATVHIGRLVGAAGFSRTVAIKHLHPHCSRDAEFVSMFLDEARLATRIQHPNVTVPLDVVVLEESEEIFLVMEYIHGDNFACLLRGARLLKTRSSRHKRQHNEWGLSRATRRARSRGWARHSAQHRSS